jgi:hypothetical protein
MWEGFDDGGTRGDFGKVAHAIILKVNNRFSRLYLSSNLLLHIIVCIAI